MTLESLSNSKKFASVIEEVRNMSRKRLKEGGLTTRGLEDWKYTSLKAVSKIDYILCEGKSEAHTPDGFDAHVVLENGEARTVKGSLDLSVWQADNLRLPHTRSPLSDAALSGLQGANVLTLTKSTADRKNILITVPELKANEYSSELLKIKVEADLKASIFLDLKAGEGLESLKNVLINIEMANGSVLDFVVLSSTEEQAASHVQVVADINENSSFNARFFELGHSLFRGDISAHLNGTGSHCTLEGLIVCDGVNHSDFHTGIFHNVAETTSSQTFKGILNGKSQNVVNGKIFVAKDAQKVDSSQYNHNLLLSDHAEVNAKPELEIYADDVKAAHGATVGQLSEEEVFYLETRGIKPEKAKEMITLGFAMDLVERVESQVAKDSVGELLKNRMAALIEGIQDV
jgi:Fe-S cluster assembly protein SufD